LLATEVIEAASPINTTNEDDLVGQGVNNNFINTGDGGADVGEVKVETKEDVLILTTVVIHTSNAEEGMVILMKSEVPSRMTKIYWCRQRKKMNLLPSATSINTMTE